ncbi:hypothetical protein [Polyangium sorediatum]|uniref:Uncharacterized protein n=1 Tax=Polyangium sorediatum TaxID=889274 RepID=A0ABT6NPN4_9BACT|nr:hypothetical protein [Polyangium sorediatum]MDI1430145.1 hypothetical protein [Polyangium sorediatum]
MSLIVCAYRRDAGGAIEWIEEEPPFPCNDLAGPESWRHKIWGSPELRRLGLRMLPSLAEADVYAEDDELDAIEAELGMLREALPALAAVLKVDAEGLRFRVENIAAAVRIARAHGGGVYMG